MGTDIYGGIEFRHPGVGTDWYDGEPWVTAIDLWPLYDGRDYATFGCLFGVRNYAGYVPLAAGRGLPADISAGLRADLEPMILAGDLDSASWVSWGELASMDPSVTPARFVGRLTWSSEPRKTLWKQQFVPVEWPPEVVDVIGPPPPDWSAALPLFEWTVEDVKCRYESLSVGAILGPDSGWPHVFAVMQALAGRYGDGGVRLVVAFD